jgi:putative transposase
MARTARASVGGVCYHVLNRGNARGGVFHKKEDYAAFLDLMEEASARLPMRSLAWCLIPSHFHLVLWPHGDGDLSRWMQWLMTSHVRRYHRHYHSSGHVCQGRFKAFPIEEDEHLGTWTKIGIPPFPPIWYPPPVSWMEEDGDGTHRIVEEDAG